MASAIDSKTRRAKLEARREPYWDKVHEGAFVGYRRADVGEGTWVARWRGEEGKQHYRALGTFVESTSLKSAHDAATKAARTWFTECDKGVIPHAKTVADVCKAYAESFTRASSAKVARIKADFRRIVDDDPLKRVELSKLRRDHLDAWRQRIESGEARVGRGSRTKKAQRSDGTINREMVPLRAALNLAIEKQLISTDIAWRSALKPIKDADRQRTLYLDRDKRKALLTAACDEIRPFLRALTLLPLRPGALAALTVRDIDARQRSLRVGVDKAGKQRYVPLPDVTVTFLRELALDKLPGAPLIGRANGEHWNKDRWKHPIRDAVAVAGLPAGTTAYTLRHSVITDLVAGGLDLLTIAQLSGTSVAMIEKH
jgi:integrase